MSNEVQHLTNQAIREIIALTDEDADLARQIAERLATLNWQQAIRSHQEKELNEDMGIMERFLEWIENGGGFCDECPESNYEGGYRRGPQYTRVYSWPHIMTPYHTDGRDAQGKRYCWKCFRDKQDDVRQQIFTLYLEKHAELSKYIPLRWPGEMRPCSECGRLVPQRTWYSIPMNQYDHSIYCVHCVATVAERQFVFCQSCNKKTVSEINGYCYDCYPIQRAYGPQVGSHLERARAAGTPATLTIHQWIATLEYFHEKCAYCQSRPSQVIEHFISISKGGGTTADNCVPACKRCNNRKGNKPPERLTEIFPRHAIERITTYLQSEKSTKQPRSAFCRALVAL